MEQFKSLIHGDDSADAAPAGADAANGNGTGPTGADAAPVTTTAGKKRSRNSKSAKEVAKEDFDEYFRDLTGHPDTPFELTTVRNIVLAGVTRSGKTTLLKVLQNPGFVDTKAPSMVSGTVNAQLHTFAAKKQDGTFVSINMVDTPGMFEITGADKAARDNAQITSVIMDCLQNELTKIHRVFFCFSDRLGLNAANVESVKLFLEKFPAIQGKCSLIVTMCEDYAAVDLVAKEEEIRRDAAIPGIATMPIFFSGSIDRQSYLREDKATIARHYEQVVGFRQRLIGHMLNDCNEPMKLGAMTKFEALQAQVQAAITELKRRVPIIIQQSGQPAKDKSFYDNCREILITINRLLENPLQHTAKDTIRRELETFFAIITADPRLVEMAANL